MLSSKSAIQYLNSLLEGDPHKREETATRVEQSVAAATRANAYEEDECRGKERTSKSKTIEKKREKRRERTVGDIANTWLLVLDLCVNIYGVCRALSTSLSSPRRLEL